MEVCIRKTTHINPTIYIHINSVVCITSAGPDNNTHPSSDWVKGQNFQQLKPDKKHNTNSNENILHCFTFIWTLKI